MQYITGDRKKGLVHCDEFSAGHVKGWLRVEREKAKQDHIKVTVAGFLTGDIGWCHLQ